MTEAGHRVLMGKEKIEVRMDVLRAKGQKGKAGAIATVPDDVDQELLADLKRLRRELAQDQGIPAYAVFADRTLLELARKRPTSLWEMRSIHGIGEAKLDRYGELFLDVLLA